MLFKKSTRSAKLKPKSVSLILLPSLWPKAILGGKSIQVCIESRLKADPGGSIYSLYPNGIRQVCCYETVLSRKFSQFAITVSEFWCTTGLAGTSYFRVFLMLDFIIREESAQTELLVNTCQCVEFQVWREVSLTLATRPNLRAVSRQLEDCPLSSAAWPFVTTMRSCPTLPCFDPG